jgi:hypothetical protein
MLQDLKRHMRAKGVADQHSRLTVCSLPGLRIEYTYEPLKAYLVISVPRLRARVMPARRVIRRPVTPVSARWPGYHRLQIRTVGTNALDGCHHLSLNARDPVSPRVGFAYKHLHGTEHEEHDSGLVHFIHVFSHDSRVF